MKLEQGFLQRPEQRLALLPKMLQSIEVLQLGNLELEALVQKELSENETIELREENPGESAETRVADPRTLRERDGKTRKAKPSQEASDRHQDMLANAPAPETTLQDHLRQQIAILDLDDSLGAALDFVIENLDENGYLPSSTEDLVAGFAHEEGRSTTVEEMDRAIGVVRSLEPRGVGARGPVECLLLQLDGNDPEDQLLRRLLVEFLEDLAKNRLPKVVKAMGLGGIEELQNLVARMKGFNTRPGAGFAREKIPAIRPDIVVEKSPEGRIEVRIEDGFLPRIGIESSYLSMARDRATPSEVREYLRGKIETGKWLIDSIEQRRLTLLKVARAVFEKQAAFLEEGHRAIRPLMMREVADEVGVHVSTVSRAVAGKYAQTPLGIVPLRGFFCAAAEGQTEASAVSVHETVREMVAAEDPKSPLSDEEIVERLKAKGIDLARRTVAKYRNDLGIPSSWRRKAF